MMISRNLNPLFRYVSILTLVIFAVLISMQGFHHHENLEEEETCNWHNIIPTGFIMTTLLVIISISGSSTKVIQPSNSIERFVQYLMTQTLLNIPPPAQS